MTLCCILSEESRGRPRRFPKGDRKALWSRPQARNLFCLRQSARFKREQYDTSAQSLRMAFRAFPESGRDDEIIIFPDNGSYGACFTPVQPGQGYGRKTGLKKLKKIKKTIDKPISLCYDIKAVRNTGRSEAACGLVAQLDRVFDYESKGRGFESRRAHQRSSC